MPHSAFMIERRSTRASSARPDNDNSRSPQSTLHKPRLPKLKGTPSSRRQYTYGSAAEPMPTRPGYRLGDDQMMDLGNAVGNFLSMQEQQDEQTLRGSMPPPPRPDESEYSFDATHDDLGAADDYSRQRGRRTGSHKIEGYDAKMNSKGMIPGTLSHDLLQPQGYDNMSDLRSYGTENDFYGDATIASSPGSVPVIHEIPPPAAPRQTRQSQLRNMHDADPAVFTEDVPQATNRQSSRRQSRQPSQPADQRKLSQPPEQFKPSQNGLRRSPRISRHQEIENPYMDDEAPSNSRSSRSTVPGLTTSRGSSVSISTTEEDDLETISKPMMLTQAAIEAFRGAPSPKQVISRVFGLSGSRPQPPIIRSNYSEQDDEIQKQIEAAEQRQRRNSWKDKWPKMKNGVPDQDEDVEEDGYESDDDLRNRTATDWWQLLNPGTYVDAVFYVFFRIMAPLYYLLGITPPTGGRAWTALDWRKHLLPGLAILALAIAGPWVYINFSLDSLPQYKDAVVEYLPTHPILPSWEFENIGSYIPSIPMPSWGSDDTTGFLNLDPDDAHAVQDFIKKFKAEFKNLKKSDKLHSDTLKQLTTVLPSVVQMELKDGKPVISSDFWHAMRDLLHGDDSILTVDKKGQLSSDKHWQMIAQRLSTDPNFTNKLEMSVSAAEGRLEKKMSKSWDGWMKKNDDKINAALGDAVKSLQSSGSQQVTTKRMEELIKEQLRKQPKSVDSTVVTRDEFLRHLKNEFSVHRSEIRAELEELQPKLEKLIRESLEMAKSEMSSKSSTMSKEDITSLVNGLVRKSLSDANLAAMANGKIQAHWDSELKNQINYFSLGAGAVANPKLSSKPYDPRGRGTLTDDDVGRGRRDKVLPVTKALLPWFDEGDCWCPAPDSNKRGNPYGVKLHVHLGAEIVPQHLVIESILPGATHDPDSRPKDIEIWADIKDPEIREVVRDFSAIYFPSPEDEWNAEAADLEDNFVKIGQTTYEGAELHDGVHVYRLSDELMTMGAATSTVVVRAVSNYGSKKRTCFYRVRLYGARLNG